MNKKRDKIIAYIVLAILAVVFVIPLTWVVLASFDANATLAVSAPTLTLDNYAQVLTNAANLRSFGNGLLMALGTSIFVVIFAMLAAYPLSRFEMRHKKLFMTSLPITTVMVPVFKIFVSVDLYDNRLGIILFMTASSMPYAIWMMKNFMDAVPLSLEEAAWIDGSGKLNGIIRVVMPLMLPGIFLQKACPLLPSRPRRSFSHDGKFH